MTLPYNVCHIRRTQSIFGREMGEDTEREFRDILMSTVVK